MRARAKSSSKQLIIGPLHTLNQRIKTLEKIPIKLILFNSTLFKTQVLVVLSNATLISLPSPRDAASSLPTSEEKTNHALNRIIAVLKFNQEKQMQLLEELNEKIGGTLRSINDSLEYQKVMSANERQRDDM